MLHRLAWEQLIIERRRLLAALAGIGFAVMLQLTQFGFKDALFESAVVVHSRLNADLILTSPLYESEVSPGTITRRRLYLALANPSTESVTPVYMSVAPFKNPLTGQDRLIILIGFDPSKPALNEPGVLENAHLLRIPDAAIFDALSRPEFGPVADLVRREGIVITEVSRRRTKIVGLFQLGVSFAGNGHLIVSDETFRKLLNRPEGVFELGLIRLKPGSDVAAVAASIKRQMPGDVQLLTLPELIAIEKGFWQKNTPIGFIFVAGAFIGLIVGAVIVYQILYTDVSDHLGEYATLKAMGYSDRQLHLVVIEQALILSIIGFPIGLGLAQLLYMLAHNATNLPLEMTVARAVMVLGFTVLMCTVSGAVALRKLRAADPAEVF